MKKAIVLGATGGHLLHILLEDEQYSEVTIFVRKKVSITNPKLQQIVLDNFHQMDQYSHCFHVDDVFCCLGTTIKKSQNQGTLQTSRFHLPLPCNKHRQAGRGATLPFGFGHGSRC